MVVVPFPRTRHRPFVQRHARRMAEYPPSTAEKHLAAQLNIQRDTMLKRGIATAIIDRELRALETAIRTELWHLVLRTPGGAA